MRKVIFTIDDMDFFKRKYNLSNELLSENFANKESFKVIYTLLGSDNTPSKYELTDYDGNEIHIDSLNNYQRCHILNDCVSYFTGGTYFDNSNEPWGVIKIEESIC